MEVSLRQLHAVADVAVVSAANESAIASEWNRYGPVSYTHLDVYKRQGYKSVAKQLADKFGFEKVAITLRESHSAFDNGWSAMLYDVASDEYCFSKKDVYKRQATNTGFKRK